jgi:hypothetical protein
VAVGGRRLLLGAIGHAVSTVAVDLCWLVGSRVGGGLAGLDVGTSAVVVTVVAAPVVVTQFLPLAVAWPPAWPSTSRPHRIWPPSSTSLRPRSGSPARWPCGQTSSRSPVRLVAPGLAGRARRAPAPRTEPEEAA